MPEEGDPENDTFNERTARKSRTDRILEKLASLA